MLGSSLSPQRRVGEGNEESDIEAIIAALAIQKSDELIEGPSGLPAPRKSKNLARRD